MNATRIRPPIGMGRPASIGRTGSRCRTSCWHPSRRSCSPEPRDNPWMMTALQAVYQHVPKLPRPEPEDPGPFSFAAQERVHRILTQEGFSGIAMETCDLSLDVAIGRGLDAAVEGALEIGPASRALEGASVEVRAAAKESIRDALAP